MTALSQGLNERLVSPNESGLDPALLVPLLRLLAAGEPVAVTDLASEAGRSEEAIRMALAATPETEYDDEGRIVGQGLTLRPTRHRFTVDGEELYTWCALDTLIFPVVIDRAATIESTSPTSGGTVRVTATPTGVTAVEPSTAVVSLVNPEDLTSIRSSFCNQVHYFTSAEDAQPWLEAHPGGEVLPVADAYRLATDLTTTMLDRVSSGTAPTPDATGKHHCC
jgi:alkylmercury lyase